MTDTSLPMPDAWSDLIEGLTILAAGQANDISPLHCGHDKLTVCADPAAFTAPQIEHLERLGFHADTAEECFYSFRFGSA